MKYLMLAKTSCGEPWDGEPRFFICEDLDPQIADWHLGHEHYNIVTAFPGQKDYGECRARDDKMNIVAYLCWCPFDTQQYFLVDILYGRISAMHKLSYAVAYMNVIYAQYNGAKGVSYLSESPCFIEVRFDDCRPAEKWAIFDSINQTYVERW